MRITGRRADGALYLSVGDGFAVILKGTRVTPTVDAMVIEALGPWLPVENTFEARREAQKALDLAQMASLDGFALREELPHEYRVLLDSTTEAKHLAAGGEHPFTYCKENVIPAMAKDGKEPDDPDAFCAWWKNEGPGSE